MLWGSIAWCSGLVEAVQSAARGVHGLNCFKVQFTAWCSDRMEGYNAESATEECMAAWKKAFTLFWGSNDCACSWQCEREK